ncbi:MAG: AAA family ATPase [Acidimicrobiales bacterium]
MATDELDAVRESLRDIPPIPDLPSGNGTRPSGTVISASRIRSRTAANVPVEKPDYLWREWLVRKGVNLLVGRQGAGKTTWATHLVALATTGQLFPGDPTARDPIHVGFMSHEDPDSRVAARLQAAGADLNRVRLLGRVFAPREDGSDGPERQWMMPRDIGALELEIAEHGISLVIIDGFGYSIDSEGEPGYVAVSQALAELNKCAERTNCVIYGLTHPPKGTSDPITSAIGSTGWTALARIHHVLGIDKDDPTKRLVRVGKTNYKEPDTGFSFEIENDEETEAGRVVEILSSDVTREEIMSTFTPTADERGQRSDARGFLAGELADGKCHSAKELYKQAEEFGISRSTLNRAKSDLGVVSEKVGYEGPWSWRLPKETGTEGPQAAAAPKTDEFENLLLEQAIPSPNGDGRAKGSHFLWAEHLWETNGTDPSKLEGLAKMAWSRHVAGVELWPEDVQALEAAGISVKR